jgi:hypothetical protein
MKKTILTLVAFMLVMGMTQCKKEQTTTNVNPADDGETVYITMKVADGGGKHIVYPGSGAVVYGDGDKIYVGNNGHYVGTLTYANGAFSGYISNPSTTDYLHFYFVGGLTPSNILNQNGGHLGSLYSSATSFTVDIADQSQKLRVLSYGHSTTTYIDGTTTYTCMLENQCGLVKFLPTTAISNNISISGMKTKAIIDFATPGIMPDDETTGALTLYSVSDSEKWAILLPQDEVANPTVTCEGFTPAISNVPAVAPNMYYIIGVPIAIGESGVIPGLFTVNVNGDQVMFSQGNLQYQAGTNIWRFAEHQYDCILGDNTNISQTYNGWIDLFGWGTSGYNHGAVCYQPWSISTTYGDYLVYGNSTANLYDQSGQADWGYNSISNGGNSENYGWRTLSHYEWDYIANKRNTPSSIRYVVATVNGVHGMIILPDHWEASYYELNNPNPSSNWSYSDNTITMEGWNSLEAHGAIFLPRTGWRNGTTVFLTDSQYGFEYGGHYWASDNFSFGSSSTVYCAYDFAFNDTGWSGSSTSYVNGYDFRSRGHAVRLVKNVE